MAKDLLYIIHHVFLPPCLPQADDSSPVHDVALIDALLTALSAFHRICPSQERGKLDACLKALEAMLEMQDNLGGLVIEKLLQRLLTIRDKGMPWSHDFAASFPTG